MIQAVRTACHSVDLETYIFTDSEPGRLIRSALTEAAERGVKVRVLIDSFGSLYLTESFWSGLRAAGGALRWFNPLDLRRFNVRDHRKLLVCDGTRAWVGGFNISESLTGDGVSHGWRDLGLELQGFLVPELAKSFQTLFDLADFRHRHLRRLGRPRANRSVATPHGHVIAAGPGRGRHPIRTHLYADLRHAREVRIVSAYFLPPGRLLRALQRVARRGGQVQLILPRLSDVPFLQSASRGLYGRLLRSKIRIAEYQPQVLHTKFILIDRTLYIGSANLDRRSLGINYELLVRLTEPAILEEARAIFQDHLSHSRPVERRAWRKTRTLWERIKSRAACTLFARIDPHLTRYQLKDLQ